MTSNKPTNSTIKRMDAIDKRMDNIETRLDNIESKINLIYTVIVGNELDKKTGLMYRLQQIERELDQVTEQNNRFKWISIGIAVGSGALGGGIMNTIISRLL
jgi:hypothetical protein